MDSSVTRAPDQIATQKIDNLVSGVTVQSEAFSWAGHPASCIRVTPLVGVTTAGDYPDDGTGLTAAASVSTLTLAASATAEDVAGCLIVMMSGSGIGQVRRIKSVSAKVCQIAPSWSITPATNDVYTLVIDTFRRSQLIIKAEFESSSSNAVLYPIFLDYPRNPSSTDGELGINGVARAARRFYGRALALAAVSSLTAGVESSGYFHASVLSEDCRGALGAKIRLDQVPGAGRIALWLASS